VTILDSEIRPYIQLENMRSFAARDRKTAAQYGSIVKAAEISNRDYGFRYSKFSAARTMRPPPSSYMHIYLGYLVVRKLGTPAQYETWMPSHVFDDLYEPVSEP
jgi:hypothetical protein